MITYTPNHNDLTIQLETKQDQRTNLEATICTESSCTVCNAERNRLNVLNNEINHLKFRIATLATASRIQAENAEEVARLTEAYRIANETIANARSNQEEPTGQERSLQLAGSTQENETNQQRADTMKQDTRTTTQKFIDAVNALPEQPTRRWSFEIEANDAGSATYDLTCLGMDAHNDSSVSTDCECECDECVHSCDCPNCRISNGYEELDHCGDCSNTEFAPDNDNPVTTSTWNGKIERACQYIEAVGGRTDSDTGGHLHVDGTGLTARKVATTIRIWRKVAELLPDLIGRGYCNFAEEITDSELQAFEQLPLYTGERYRAINANNLSGQFRGRAENYKNTLEFRQFAGTLDYRQIIARGYLCRAIVEKAIRNDGIYWVLRCTTAEQLLRELGLPTT
jgi:hypothetical protein